jgi:alpha-ribazole phosphatase
MNGVHRTILDFLRHGEPVGGSKYRGQSDDPLSERGWAEMRAAVGHQRPWSAIVSSPLSRCRSFAEAMAAQMGLRLILDERLKEVGFGQWEGQSRAEIQRRDPDWIFEFKCDPLGRRPPGAEDLGAFYRRVSEAFDEIVTVHEGGHALVVAHAGVIRMAICRVLGIPPGHAYRIQVGSAAVARFKAETHNGRRLIQLSHLSPGVHVESCA